MKEWLSTELPPSSRVGIDPFVHTVFETRELEAALAKRDQALVPLAANPVDAVWGAARPAAPTAPLRVHDLAFAGEDVAGKVQRTLEAVEKAGADAMLVTDLAEVAWLLNLRGADVECNPVFLAYAVVAKDGTTLFVDEAKVRRQSES